jgi:copper chaperone CopZ
MDTLSLALRGMGCGGCVKNVRKVLDALPGVAVQNVTVGSALLTYDAAQSTKETVVEALGKAGYPAQEVGRTAVAKAGVTQNGAHCGV